MFAAKYKTHSIAKIFAKAGKDLGNPISSKALRVKKAAVGQTEERIHEYLQSIGVPKRKEGTIKTIGVPFTKYSEIPKPDVAPLAKSFDPTFMETLLDNPKRKDVNPIRALS